MHLVWRHVAMHELGVATMKIAGGGRAMTMDRGVAQDARAEAPCSAPSPPFFFKWCREMPYARLTDRAEWQTQPGRPSALSSRPTGAASVGDSSGVAELTSEVGTRSGTGMLLSKAGDSIAPFNYDWESE